MNAPGVPFASFVVRGALAALAALATSALMGCSEPQPSGHGNTAAPAPAESEGGAAQPHTGFAVDAGAASSTPMDGTTSEGPRIGAMFMETPIMSDMEWPERDRERPVRRAAQKNERDKVIRLGYLRHGSTAPVIPEADVKPNCVEGWYELVAGGFVCGKYATLDLNHPRVRLAPHPPDMTAALPYQYGYNLTNGTPLYRQIPSRKDRIRYEPWLSPRPKPKPVDDDTNPYSANASADVDLDAGAGATLAGLALATARDPLALGLDEDAGTPWYLREFDGGKPTNITLDELRGEGPVIRRMVKGFFVALDKDIKVNNVKWWRTTAGYVVPYERLMVHKPATDFHGIWLKDDAPAWPPPLANPPKDVASTTTAAPAVIAAPLASGAPVDAGVADAAAPRRHTGAGPVAFIYFGKAKKYAVTADHKQATAGERIEYRSALKLTGATAKIGDVTYEESDEGFWVRGIDIVKTKPGPAPTDLAPNEKWVDVNLTNQTLVAFEGTTPVFATLVSSGKKDPDDPEKDHKTPTGSYRIWAKHIAATMDGDVASDGPYSIEDVPWIMYFQGSYALHGAFWHGVFGRERSHGCVNLSPPDARAMFGWTEPALPEGWHGVRATDQRPGTRVIVHE